MIRIVPAFSSSPAVVQTTISTSVLLEDVEDLERTVTEPDLHVDAGGRGEPHQRDTQPHEEAEVTPVDVEAAVEDFAQLHGPEVRANGSLRAGTRGKMRTWRLPRETSIYANTTASRRLSTSTSASSWPVSVPAWRPGCWTCCSCSSA